MVQPIGVFAVWFTFSHRHAEVGPSGYRLGPKRIVARPALGNGLDKDWPISGAAAGNGVGDGGEGSRGVGAVQPNCRDVHRSGDAAQIAAGSMNESWISFTRRP